MSYFHPLVSIVIPVYNGADYMREAIDSALAQTYDNVEVIVVNDGSTDNGKTDCIARLYGDKIRYFSKENGGVATALNLGIREMRGTYFSWLSHDDVYFPKKIERQITFMDKLELYDAVLYSDVTQIDGNGDLLQEQRLPCMQPDYFFQYVYLNHIINGCSLLIPRSAFDETCMFNEHLKTTQDHDLWLRMCRKRPFIHQAEALIQSRLHKNQGSRVIPEHAEEVRVLYKHFLPDWLDSIAVEGCTRDEIIRRKLLCIKMLQVKGLTELVEDVLSLATDDEERTILCIGHAKLKRRIRFKAGVKQILRLFWKLLPKQMRNSIRLMKNSLAGSTETDFIGQYSEFKRNFCKIV